MPEPRPVHRYTAYGLSFESELRCPGFLPGRAPIEARVAIGRVPPHLENPVVRGMTHESEPGKMLFTFRGIARFLVVGGREIIVEPAEGASEDDIAVFLTTVGLGALLLQRGTFLLHAAACATGERAILLAGRSGFGKSTLLAALLRRGYGMLADDVSAIGLDAGGRVTVHPASPWLKLFTDSIDSLDAGGPDVRRVLPNDPKSFVPASDAFLTKPHRVQVVYVLDYGSTPEIELTPLTGQDRFAALRAQTYGRRIVEGLKLQTLHFGVVAALAAQVPIVSLKRPRGLDVVVRVADAIDRHQASMRLPSES